MERGPGLLGLEGLKCHAICGVYEGDLYSWNHAEALESSRFEVRQFSLALSDDLLCEEPMSRVGFKVTKSHEPESSTSDQELMVSYSPRIAPA